MTAQRMPKRPCSHKMCFECMRWHPVELDWGECSDVADYVSALFYRLTYAYGGCFFELSKFKEKDGE